ARTSVKVTYCDPAPNLGAGEPGSVVVQLTPSPEVNANCWGRAATLRSGWVVSVLSVTYTWSDVVRPLVLAVNVTVDCCVPSAAITTGFGAVTATETNSGGVSPMTLAAFGLRSELSWATWWLP